MAYARLLVLAAACFVFAGCQKKETVVDVKTPIGDVEVTKDTSNGDVEVNVDTPAEAE